MRYFRHVREQVGGEVMSTLETFVYVREQVEEKLCLTPGNVSMSKSKSTVADRSRYGKT
jgi:hypothetical protein